LFIGNCTYEKKRTKIVKSVTSGKERTKISCAFCASANGEKLPVLVLIPRKTPIKNFTPPDNVWLFIVAVRRRLSQIQLIIVLFNEFGSPCFTSKPT
jgi:hypothetical protein